MLSFFIVFSSYSVFFFFFFFNDTATTEIYTLSLHDALPICLVFMMATIALLAAVIFVLWQAVYTYVRAVYEGQPVEDHRSEEHTSELQSRLHLVCRLLLEKKKKKNNNCRIDDVLYYVCKTSI